jgi:EAL domain-containing protein (putative c-di-GMP-specific phosphodiesterase class I)
MLKKVLAVAGPEWQAALSSVAGGEGPQARIELRNAADAVVLLATQPDSFSALALEARAGGPWLNTLLDLTLGDTEQTVPLVMLGGEAATLSRLSGAATLHQPVDAATLSLALARAASNSRHIVEHPPEALPNVESIRVRYQPVVRLADMRPVSVETLARVVAADGQLIGPETIVQAMTNGERAMSLTRLIVQVALAERAEGHFDRLCVAFAFNLPLDALLHPELLPIVEAIREEAGLRPALIRFELTENQPVTDLASAALVIGRLRDCGYRLALDDITPETPNLDLLLELPFSAVKLDRGVVMGALSADAEEAARNLSFISRVAVHAGHFGRAVIAEGIESPRTLALMRELGVTHGQGFHFARPLPARALQPWLTHWQSSVECLQKPLPPLPEN